MHLIELAPMLRTDDIPGTISFYTSVMGFGLDGQWPEDDPCWCSLVKDRVNVMFTTQAEKGQEGQPLRMTGRLYFYVTDVMALLDAIKDRVDVIEGPEVYFYGMKEIAIRDPNGYVLTFGEKTGEPCTCNPADC